MSKPATISKLAYLIRFPMLGNVSPVAAATLHLEKNIPVYIIMAMMILVLSYLHSYPRVLKLGTRSSSL